MDFLQTVPDKMTLEIVIGIHHRNHESQKVTGRQ